MSVTVCTGFSPIGRVEYGERFLRTFSQFWPADVGLKVFVEHSDAKLEASMRDGTFVSLWSCPGVEDFIKRHINRPEAVGRQPGPKWKSGDVRRGYSFRFDAVKFCRQLFIPETAAAGLADGDILVWLDADVVTYRQIPNGFVEGMLGDADCCYLGRGRKHSEIGFWAVRLNPLTRGFLGLLAATYRSDIVFSLGEWHSAFVWDACRTASADKGVRFLDLTPGGQDHVWMQSPLVHYTDHVKGDRKRQGFSHEHPNARQVALAR